MDALIAVAAEQAHCICTGHTNKTDDALTLSACSQCSAESLQFTQLLFCSNSNHFAYISLHRTHGSWKRIELVTHRWPQFYDRITIGHGLCFELALNIQRTGRIIRIAYKLNILLSIRPERVCHRLREFARVNACNSDSLTSEWWQRKIFLENETNVKREKICETVKAQTRFLHNSLRAMGEKSKKRSEMPEEK